MKSSTKTLLFLHFLILFGSFHSILLSQQTTQVQKSHVVENQAVSNSKIRFVAGRDGDLFGKKRNFIENIGQYGDSLSAALKMGNTLYGYEGLDMPVLFTSKGCEGTASINIKVYKGGEIYVPSAFTPNGDGMNDVLKAIPVGIKKFLYFSIYNRWGERIFYTNDPSKGWNGRIEDKLQSGVFVWMAEGTDYAGKTVFRKGTTIVIR